VVRRGSVTFGGVLGLGRGLVGLCVGGVGGAGGVVRRWDGACPTGELISRAIEGHSGAEEEASASPGEGLAA
jgi:hypothetical protein